MCPICNHENHKPWRVEPMKIHGWAIHDAEGNVVVKDIYDEDIARRIVRAVNAHRPLVDAIESRASDAAMQTGLGVSEWRSFLTAKELHALALEEKES